MTIVQNTNFLVVPDGYVKLIPPQPVIQGVATNVLGLVGIASYGPVNIPVVVGSPQQEIQNFGPVLTDKYDLGTAVYNSAIQGSQFFICVRVTDGTDTSSTANLEDIDSGTGVILTSLYTGEYANTITATIAHGSSYTPSSPTYQLVVNIQGGIPETFDNIGGTGAAFWNNLITAVNTGQSIARGPSNLVVASLFTGISAVTVTTPGEYTTLPTISTTGPGSGATFQIHAGGFLPTLVAGGSGYAINDTITILGGTHSTASVITVNSVDGGGAILTFHMSTAGNYTTLPTNPVSQATTSGVGTGATFNYNWITSSVAVTSPGTGYTNTSGISFSAGGTIATLVVGSVSTPAQTTVTLTGGTNGNDAVTSETLVGSDVAPRTGMYSLRQTGAFVVMLADADDPAQWPAQAAFALSNSCYVVGTVAAGYQDNIAGALTLLQDSAIDNYGFKLMHGDWCQFSDPFNNVVRYVSPQAFTCGELVTQPPFTSALNKILSGIVATQRTAEGNPYSTADLAQLITGRLDVITRPIPASSFSFGCRLGVNTSSNFLTKTDNYPLMANFIGQSISNAIGVYIGQAQTPTVRTEARNAIQTFLMGLFQQGYIGDVNNPGNAAAAFQVILDESNNPTDRVAAGYMQADVTVVIFSIIQFFVVNVNIVQGSSSISIPPPTQNT